MNGWMDGWIAMSMNDIPLHFHRIIQGESTRDRIRNMPFNENIFETNIVVSMIDMNRGCNNNNNNTIIREIPLRVHEQRKEEWEEDGVQYLCDE